MFQILAFLLSTTFFASGHDFGVNRAKKIPRLERCQKNSKLAKKYPQSYKYLNSLARHIMKSNKKIFWGSIAPGRLCFNVEEEINTVNAVAMPISGDIALSTGSLMLRSDAWTASVLAHELAHISMQHSGDDLVWMKPLLRKARSLKGGKKVISLANDVKRAHTNYFNAESKFAMNDLEEVVEKWCKKQSNTDCELQSAFSHIFDEGDYALEPWEDSGLVHPSIAKYRLWYQNFIKTTYLKSRPQHKKKVQQYLRVNKSFEAAEKVYFKKLNHLHKVVSAELGNNMILSIIEQEADEVGFEIFLRAGFDPLVYRRFIYSDFQYQECLRELRHGKVERGKGSHPANCWRHRNLDVTEMKFHAKDYNVFHGNNKLNIFSSNFRLKVKTEIQAASGNVSGPKEEPAEEPTPLPKTLVKKACKVLGGDFRVHSHTFYVCLLEEL